jgi:hypothetical protein
MKRGAKYSQGLALAIPFALRRGHVMVFLAALLNLAEFLITGNGLFVLVRVRLARKIKAGVADIEAEFADAIAGLRLVPRTGPVSCELWVYSRYGILRYFRVVDTRLVEIDCCGTPLDQLKTTEGPAPSHGQGAGLAGTRAEPFVSGSVTPATDPACLSIRWLKKWNAARKAAEQSGRSVNDELVKILDAKKPGAPEQQTTNKKTRRKNGTKNAGDTPENFVSSGSSVPEGATPQPGSQDGPGELPHDGKGFLPAGTGGTGELTGDDPNGA